MNRTEEQDMFVVFDWQRMHPKLDRLIWHNCNEGKRSPVTGRRLKRAGLKRGVPDITCAIPAHGFHGFYIEMKVGSNKPSVEQKEMMRDLFSMGYKVMVCYSAEEAIRELRDYITGNDSLANIFKG